MLSQVDDTEVINFLLTTEIIPLCLRTMEMGSELSKTVATFIVQKILLDDVSRPGADFSSCANNFIVPVICQAAALQPAALMSYASPDGLQYKRCSYLHSHFLSTTAI